MNAVLRSIAGVLLVGAVSGPTAWAQGTPSAVKEQEGVATSELGAHPPMPFEKACVKLGRGIANTLGGWLEIPLNIYKQYQPTGRAEGFFAGTIIGLFKGVVRTVVGAYETVTFILPYPNNYGPVLPDLEYTLGPTKTQPHHSL